MENIEDIDHLVDLESFDTMDDANAQSHSQTPPHGEINFLKSQKKKNIKR